MEREDPFKALACELFKLFPQGVVFLDLETTGLNSFEDEIIEVACLKLTPAGQKSFESFIRPLSPISEDSTKIHGIDNQMVAKAPKFSQVAEELVSFIGGFPLFAHNAPFDLSFLLVHFMRSQIQWKNNSVYCTLKAAKRFLRSGEAKSLQALAKRYKIEAPQAHRAMADVQTLMSVFEKMLESSPDQEWKKAAEIYTLSQFQNQEEWILPKHLDALRNVLKSPEVVEIEYKSKSSSELLRKVYPMGIYALPRGAVLYAQCLKTGLFKSYFIQKIRSISLLSAEDQLKWIRKREELNREYKNKQADAEAKT